MAAPWMLLGHFLRVAPGPQDAEAGRAAAADFSVPVAAPPHITVVTAIHPEYPNMYPYRPYVVVANRVGLLVHFDTDAFHGVPFVLVREFHHHPEAEAPEGEMMTLTATAERLPPRDDIVGNILSISLAELVVTTGSECASIFYCFAAEPSSGSSWFEEYVDCPLVDHDRSWVPSGVVFHDDRHWWFDLSWGLLSCNADPDEFMVLLFHDLPEGRALDASQLNIHERRCIAASRNALRYVEIMAEGETSATVSMWRAVPVHDDDGDYNIVWEMAYGMSFEEIWNDFSYTATRMPRRVPVLTAVSPTNPDLVFFSLVHERRLFGVNVPQHRVVVFVDEAVAAEPDTRGGCQTLCASLA